MERTIMVCRHGEYGMGDITDEAVQRLYSSRPFKASGNISDVMFLHSDKPRTYQTGLALLAGAFSYPRPRNVVDLYRLDMPTDNRQASWLGLGGLNEIPYGAEIGEAINQAIETKDDTSYAKAVRADYAARKASFEEFYRDFAAGPKSFALLVTHGYNIELLFMALANSAQPNPDLSKLGGHFNTEQYFLVTLDEEPRLLRNDYALPCMLK